MENEARLASGRELLKIPSPSTIRRRIKELDPFEVLAHREGPDAARRKLAPFEAGMSATYPLERVEIDEWQIDVATVLGNIVGLEELPPLKRSNLQIGRRWIYVAIDCATRCVVGFSIAENPSQEAAIRVLEQIVQDKTEFALAAGCGSSWDFYGGIGAIVADQGPAFSSHLFRSTVATLGVTYETPPAGVPKLRPKIERFFRTLTTKLAPLLTGRTFSNPVERGDYPSENLACLTDDDLSRTFISYIVDVYHNTPSGGLNGETPANAWRRLVSSHGVTPPPNSNTRRAIFGIPVKRRIGRHGLRVNGINYGSKVLHDQLLHGRQTTFDVRLDPADLSEISFLLNGTWHAASCTKPNVGVITLEDWKAVITEQRARNLKNAEIHEDTIQKAVERIRSRDRSAQLLMRVQPPSLTGKQIDRLENDLFLGMEIIRRNAVPARQTNRSDILFDIVRMSSSEEQPSTEDAFGSLENPGAWKLSDE